MQAEVPLPGKRIRLVDATQPSGRRSLLGISAKGVTLAGIDPTVTGATLAMYSRVTGQLQTVDLPAQRWARANAQRPTFRCLDPADRAVRATIGANGVWRFTVRGPSSVYALGTPQTEVAARLTVGGVRYCAVFGGEIRCDDGRRFLAVNARAAPSGPLAPGETALPPPP